MIPYMPGHNRPDPRRLVGRIATLAGAALALVLLVWGMASISGGLSKAGAVPLDSVTLNRNPAPPDCVNPGGVEGFNWSINFSSIPDHYVYSITNPLNNVVYGPFTVNIQGQPSPVTGSDSWPVPVNAMPGNYRISLWYYSNFGLEATALVVFTVCAPPTNTPARTNTPTPTGAIPPPTTFTPTGTPVCSTPVVVVTPAFTPAPGCSSTPPSGTLTAVITDHPTTTSALFTNRSSTCSYPVGLAIYQKFGPDPEDQVLYDYNLAVIPPNSTLTLTVNNPTCAYQAYAFYGPLIVSFSGGSSYGSRLLDSSSGNGTDYCTSACFTPHATSTPTSTRVITATATATPTATCIPRPTAPPGKVIICHATGSETNPYEEITISEVAAKEHRKKHSGDIIPAPACGCPRTVVTLTPTSLPATNTGTRTPTSAATSTPTATVVPCILAQTFTGSITAGDPTHTNFVNFASGGPSVCGATPACPRVITDASNYHYDTYIFTNTTGAPQCVTVSVNATGCGPASVGLGAYAYLNSFNPANLCANYAGGFNSQISPGPSSYAFTMPAGSTFVVEVEEYVAGTGCASYTVAVGSCAANKPVEQKASMQR